jgi:hypothetical protein
MTSVALDAFAKRTDLHQYAPNALAIFALQLRFGVEDAEDLADSITDGTGDKKIDVFYIDEEYGVAVVIQAYESEDGNKVNPPLNKVSDVNAAVSWLINPTDVADLPLEIQSAAAQLGHALEDGTITAIELWYSHNCPDNADVDTELKQVEITAKALLEQVYGEKATSVNVLGVQVGRDKLDKLYAQRTQQILIEDTIRVPTFDGWLSQAGDAWSAVCASVPGSWLRFLYDSYGSDRLFTGNVRDFLGVRRSTANINHNISTTASERPKDFWAFNNGVTALVSEIIISEGQLSIRGITIVNGAQTTGALSEGKAGDEVTVLTRFVQCTDRRVVQDLIRANNTQNEIVSSDFRSKDQYQVRLREEFKRIPQAHYTGARRGEVTESEAGADDMNISADLAAQALTSLHGEPQRAYHGKSKIWEEDSLYDRFFAHTSATHIVYATSLVRAIVERKRALREATPLSKVEQEILDFLSQRGATFLLAAAIGRSQEIILGAAVPNLFGLSFGELVSPAVAQEYWAPVVRSLIAFHGTLSEAAKSGRIRSFEIREAALNSFRQQVYAIQAGLEETVFHPFRASVVTQNA